MAEEREKRVLEQRILYLTGLINSANSTLRPSTSTTVAQHGEQRQLHLQPRGSNVSSLAKPLPLHHLPGQGQEQRDMNSHPTSSVAMQSSSSSVSSAQRIILEKAESNIKRLQMIQLELEIHKKKLVAGTHELGSKSAQSSLNCRNKSGSTSSSGVSSHSDKASVSTAGNGITDIIQVSNKAAMKTQVSQKAASQTLVLNKAATQTQVSNRVATPTQVSQKAAIHTPVLNKEATQTQESNKVAIQTHVLNKAVPQAQVSNKAAVKTQVLNKAAIQTQVSNKAATQSQVSQMAAVQTPVLNLNKETVKTQVLNKRATQTQVSNKAATQTQVSQKAAVQIPVLNKEATQTQVSNKAAVKTQVSNKASSKTQVLNKAAPQTQVSNKAATQTQVSQKAAVQIPVLNKEATQTQVSNKAAVKTQVSNKASSKTQVLNKAAPQTQVSNKAATQTQVSQKAAVQIPLLNKEATQTQVSNKAASQTQVLNKAAPQTQVSNKAVSQTQVLLIPTQVSNKAAPQAKLLVRSVVSVCSSGSTEYENTHNRLSKEEISSRLLSINHVCPLNVSLAVKSGKDHLTLSSQPMPSRKDKLISKSAQVTAAREAMQNKLDMLKCSLAELTAAKKTFHLKQGTTTSQSDAEIAAATVSAGCKQNRNQTQGVKLKAVASSECALQQNCFHNLSMQTDFSPETSSAKIKKSSDSDNKAGVQVAKAPPSAVQQKLRPPLFALAKDKAAGFSPSKSSSKSQVADLAKELRATEDKLCNMRQKMGVMLKGSPSKTKLLGSAVSMTSMKKKPDLRTLSLAAATPGPSLTKGKTAVGGKTYAGISKPSPCGSNSKSSVLSDKKRRPFPNHKSLHWTPQTSPLRASSQTMLVVGSSPSTKFYQQAAAKAVSTSWNRTASAAPSPSRHTLRVRRKTSCFSFVASPLATYSPPVQSASQEEGASRPFVGRYKLQRLGSGSGPNVTVQSRYKLMKIGPGDTSDRSQSQPGYAVPRTASQRAARVIKSKYKMRKVPLLPGSPSAAGTSPWTPPQHARNNGQGVAGHPMRAPSYEAMSNQRRYAASQSPYSGRASARVLSTSVYAAAGRGAAGRKRSGGSGWPYFQRGGWNNAWQSDCGAWDGQWPQHHTRKTYAQQQASRARAKAVMAWKRQQQMNAAQLPFNCNPSPWRVQALKHKLKCEQRQKRQLLKRLQWIRKYNLGRKQASRGGRYSPTKRRCRAGSQDQLVMINGILYKSSSRRLTKAASSSASRRPSSSKPGAGAASAVNSSVLVRNMRQRRMQTVTVRGVSFKVNTTGTRLQRVHSDTVQDNFAAVSRVDVGGTTYVQTEEGVLEKIFDSQTRSMVNRVKQLSIARVTAKRKKDNRESRKTKKTCLFFSRFGKCSRGEQCPYLHDPEKIAVCTRFLRGTCKVDRCPFSHKVSKEKMPVCAFFLRGVCTHEDCPYLHVKVSQGAAICTDFVNGFCPLAEKCPKVHTLTCPHFAKTGKCPDGKKCRLYHRKTKSCNRSGKTATATSSLTVSGQGKGAKRAALPVKTLPDSPRDLCSPPALKRNKAQTDDQPPQLEDAGHVSTAAEVQTEVSAAVSPDSQERAGGAGTPRADASKAPAAHTGRQGDPGDPVGHTPACLPAFISLADYSLGESPVPAAAAPSSRSGKNAMLRTESVLQIKPRL